MGLKIAKQVISTGVAVWSTILETAMGGFTLDKTGYVDGDRIPAGQPVGFDESTRVAKIIKTATLYSTLANTDLVHNVLKGHGFSVGEIVAGVKGGKAYAITAIDKSNAAYDVITVGTTLALTLAAGKTLFQSAAAGASAAVFFVTPKGLVFEETEVNTNESLSVVLRGTLYARRAPVNNADIEASLPLIIFSQSY